MGNNGALIFPKLTFYKDIAVAGQFLYPIIICPNNVDFIYDNTLNRCLLVSARSDSRLSQIAYSELHFNSSSNCLNCLNNDSLFNSTNVFDMYCGNTLENKNFNCGTTCDPSCLNCQNTATNCLACSYKYKPLTDVNTTCLNYTKSGYWEDTLVYQKCPSNCANCSNSTVCNQCLSNYYLMVDNTSLCVTSCPTGYYMLNNICQK